MPRANLTWFSDWLNSKLTNKFDLEKNILQLQDNAFLKYLFVWEACFKISCWMKGKESDKKHCYILKINTRNQHSYYFFYVFSCFSQQTFSALEPCSYRLYSHKASSFSSFLLLLEKKYVCIDARSLHGWTWARSSWQNPNIKIQHTRGGNKDGQSGGILQK